MSTNRRSGSFRPYLLAFVAVVAAGSVAATAQAGKGGDGTPDPRACRGAQEAQVLATSSDAVVYRRDAQTFGCLYKDDVERTLPHRIGLIDAASPRLAGRFVAYVTFSDTVEFINVFDLHAGRLTMDQEATSDCGACAVRAHVVKSSGSVAWLGQGPRNIEGEPGRQDAQGRVHVYRRVAGRRRSRQLASGDLINPHYLVLSGDRKSVVWRQGGVKQRARLP
jgi:hypothetical protein